MAAGFAGETGPADREWDEAAADADAVLDGPSAPLARTWPLVIRALVALRRDGGGVDDIDEAWRLACRYGEPMRTLPAAAAVAERSWLTGSDDRMAECLALLEDGPVAGLEWARGELAVWLRRLGRRVNAAGVAEPYRLVLDGAHEAAAEQFDRLRRRTTPRWRSSTRVTANWPPRARRTRPTRRGRGRRQGPARPTVAGVAVVPARRRSATLVNPAGLTARQIEVLRLLDDGLTNTELAERLYLSVKTVDHHVSAILTKLEVTKRRDAVRRARELGLLT